MLVLGDAHAADADNREALLSAYDAVEQRSTSPDSGARREATDADVALQLGDLEYYDLPVETWFIAGNNEDFDVIEALRAGEDHPEVSNAHLLASTAVELQGLRIAGLSGNHAPTRYERSRSELADDRRRHFVRDDVEQLAALEDVDVLLTHEAPHGLLYYSYDPGCQYVNELLDALDPELCLVGHHHRHVEAEIRGSRVVGLAPAWERYYELDPTDLTLESHETPG